MKNSIPAAAWAWLLLVSVASFLTWAVFKTSFSSNFGGFPVELLGETEISASAWKSYLRLWGMQIPNWLPVVAAFAAVGAFYALGRGADLSPKLPKILLIYAFVHVLFFTFMVWGGNGSVVGFGALLTLFALGGLWKTIVRKSKASDVKTAVT